jgi:hypothetical protein
MQVQQLKKSDVKKTGKLKGAEHLEGEETNECIIAYAWHRSSRMHGQKHAHLYASMSDRQQ